MKTLGQRKSNKVLNKTYYLLHHKSLVLCSWGNHLQYMSNCICNTINLNRAYYYFSKYLCKLRYIIDVRGIKYHRSDTNITKVQHCLKRVNDSPSTILHGNKTTIVFMPLMKFLISFGMLFMFMIYDLTRWTVWFDINFSCAKYIKY